MMQFELPENLDDAKAALLVRIMMAADVLGFTMRQMSRLAIADGFELSDQFYATWASIAHAVEGHKAVLATPERFTQMLQATQPDLYDAAIANPSKAYWRVRDKYYAHSCPGLAATHAKNTLTAATGEFARLVRTGTILTHSFRAGCIARQIDYLYNSHIDFADTQAAQEGIDNYIVEALQYARKVHDALGHLALYIAEDAGLKINEPVPASP